MSGDEEFFDAISFADQSQPDLFSSSPLPFSLSISGQSSFKPHRDPAEYKTDISLAAAKTELFSWTSLNLSKTKNKSLKEFSGLEIIQEIQINANNSRFWVLKFSPDGYFLAVAGQGPEIYILKVSVLASEDSNRLLSPPDVYSGHDQYVLSVAWASSSSFFLSCGTDCSVLLWQLSQRSPLRHFSHSHMVTCLGFSPADENLFFTGSLSKRLCLWDTAENCVANIYQTQGLITAAAYSPNGSLLAVGMSDGKCVIYEVHHSVLTFLTQIHCKNRNGFKSAGKNVTGIEFQDDLYMLVTTNDSRIRLYNLQNFAIVQKYKGGKCEHCPLRATFSHNFGHVIRGSEDGKVVVWNTFKIMKRKRWSFGGDMCKNESYEYFESGKGKEQSDAVFAPSCVVNRVQEEYLKEDNEVIISHVVVCAKAGKVVVMYNQFKNVPC
jgi:WD40 repeat protein